jgi:DUF1680 family protein
MQENDDTLVLNWYGPSKMSTTIAKTPIEIEQQTNYPRNGRVRINVTSTQPATFKLKLRIPQWSDSTTIFMNDIGWMGDAKPGTYITIAREWRAGDHVTLTFDFSPHIWPGEKECAGKVSIYRGPILFAMNLPDKTPLPTLTLDQIKTAELQPYFSAGANGVRYATWLPVKDAPSNLFTRSLPTVRVVGEKRQ